MLNVKITGLETLQRELGDAQRALASLDGSIATLKVEPNDPASVQAATRHMEAAVDSKVGAYGSNPLISEVVEVAKEHYRSQILKLADSNK